MPKIVINEYDLTKAGTSEYENFAVVVPGYLGDNANEAVFDENGIYECSSQVDFENNVGKRAAKIITRATSELTEATAPTVSLIIRHKPNLTSAITITESKTDPVTQEITPAILNVRDPEKFASAFNALLAGKLDIQQTIDNKDITLIETSETPETPETPTNPEVEDDVLTYPSENDGNDGTGVQTLSLGAGNSDRAESSYGRNDSKSYGIYYARVNSTGFIGELTDKSNVYYEVNIDPNTTQAYAAFPTAEDGELNMQPMHTPMFDTYYLIYDDNKGTDGAYVIDEISHYGNQIAYELLGLGYTVLYKKMTEYTSEQLTNGKINSADTTNTIQLVKKVNIGTVTDPEYVIDYDYDYKTNTSSIEKAIAGSAQNYTNEFGAAIVHPDYSAINELSDPDFWECLKDKSTYDFRYLVTGLLTNNDGANKCIMDLADHSAEIKLDDASIKDGRGDCIALIDLDKATYEGKTQSNAIKPMAEAAAKWASAYAAVFAPYVRYIMPEDKDYDNNDVFPASFHYLACAANSSNNNYKEWYANAGYTRGISKYTIQSTGCKLGEVAIQSLEPRFMLKVGTVIKDDEYLDVNTTVAVNLIVKIKSGYYLWGNRTGKKLGTRYADDGDLVAQHFLNVRQLCTTIKKQVYVTCRRLTFDPNSDVLWTNFTSLLTPMLEGMKADQGIKDYKLVRNKTDRKALLSAKIRIVPIEAVEDFEIGLYLEDSLEDVVLTEA